MHFLSRCSYARSKWFAVRSRLGLWIRWGLSWFLVLVRRYSSISMVVTIKLFSYFRNLHARHRHMRSPVFVRTSPWCCRCRYARFLERRGLRGSSQRTEGTLRHNLVERQVKVSVLVHFWQIPLGSMAQPFFVSLRNCGHPRSQTQLGVWLIFFERRQLNEERDPSGASDPAFGMQNKFIHLCCGSVDSRAASCSRVQNKLNNGTIWYPGSVRNRLIIIHM